MNGIPILAFHAIEAGPAPLCIHPDGFRRQVEILADHGVTDISLAELVAALATGAPWPERRVAFTFDDAYASVADHALPILAASGFRATVFAVTGVLGAANDWDPPAPGGGLRVMSRSTLADLRSEGWEIGSHTHSHRSLVGLDDVAVLAEMATADADLEELLGTPISWFAYPYGHHDDRIRRLAAGRYRAAVATGARLVKPGADRSRLPRIEAWYLRRPTTLAHLHDRTGASYLAARRALRAVRSGARRG